MVIEAEKYTLVGVDIDATGRRLVDEIVQLSAYNPTSQYSQYIMPYINLNPAARQRHQLRVVNIRNYRMLKCTRTNKMLKSKSEFASLKEFLNWLEILINSDTKSNGAILIYHEKRKFVPYMLIEGLKKYNLLDKFLATVKGFVNGFELATLKCPDNLKPYSIRGLSRTLLNKKEIYYYQKYRNSSKQKSERKKLYFEGCANVRAKLVFEIFQYLSVLNSGECGNDMKKIGFSKEDLNMILEFNDNALKAMLKSVAEIKKPICNDFDELEREKKKIERQRSFRPVLLEYFEAELYHRIKAVKFRIILSESGYDYENLKAIWTEKRKEGLTEVIQTIPLLNAEEKSELIDLLDAHYDPTKLSMQPPIREFKKNNRKFRGRKSLKFCDTSSNNVKENQKIERKQVDDV